MPNSGLSSVSWLGSNHPGRMSDRSVSSYEVRTTGLQASIALAKVSEHPPTMMDSSLSRYAHTQSRPSRNQRSTKAPNVMSSPAAIRRGENQAAASVSTIPPIPSPHQSFRSADRRRAVASFAGRSPRTDFEANARYIANGSTPTRRRRKDHQGWTSPAVQRTYRVAGSPVTTQNEGSSLPLNSTSCNRTLDIVRAYRDRADQGCLHAARSTP